MSYDIDRHIVRRVGEFRAHPQRSYINPEFARRVKTLSTRPLYEVSVHQTQAQWITGGHLAQRMESWAANGARHNLVYAYPLLDRRVLEFGLGIPPDQFFKRGWKRYLFRRSMENILPADLQWNKAKDDPALFAAARECRDLAIPYLIAAYKNTFKRCFC